MHPRETRCRGCEMSGVESLSLVPAGKVERPFWVAFVGSSVNDDMEALSLVSLQGRCCLLDQSSGGGGVGGSVFLISHLPPSDSYGVHRSGTQSHPEHTAARSPLSYSVY